MSDETPESILITIEIPNGKGPLFLDCLYEIDVLRKKGKPVSAKLLNKFFESFITQRKSNEERTNRKIKNLLEELFSTFGKAKYDFQFKQFRALGIWEVLPNGKRGKEEMELAEYSLTDLATKIYSDLIDEKNKVKFVDIGDFIRYVNNCFVDYLRKIKSEKEILSKWKIGLLTTSMAVQFGHLLNKKDYLKVDSGIKYEDYLYDKFRYYTERDKKSKRLI